MMGVASAAAWGPALDAHHWSCRRRSGWTRSTGLALGLGGCQSATLRPTATLLADPARGGSALAAAAASPPPGTRRLYPKSRALLPRSIRSTAGARRQPQLVGRAGSSSAMKRAGTTAGESPPAGMCHRGSAAAQLGARLNRDLVVMSSAFRARRSGRQRAPSRTPPAGRPKPSADELEPDEAVRSALRGRRRHLPRLSTAARAAPTGRWAAGSLCRGAVGRNGGSSSRSTAPDASVMDRDPEGRWSSRGGRCTRRSEGDVDGTGRLRVTRSTQDRQAHGGGARGDAELVTTGPEFLIWTSSDTSPPAS
jgi:hypothetical protein